MIMIRVQIRPPDFSFALIAISCLAPALPAIEICFGGGRTWALSYDRPSCASGYDICG
jgi:hypothetical protein